MKLRSLWPGLALIAALGSGCSYMENYLNEYSTDADEETLETGLVADAAEESEESPVTPEAERSEETVQPVLLELSPVSFFGNSSASLGITRVAPSTTLDPELARALGVEGKPGITSKSGFYDASPAELALQLQLESNPYFSQLATLLNPHASVLTVAEGSFTIEQSSLSQQELTLPNGVVQQYYFLKIETSFSLVDRQNQLVYRTRSIDQSVHVCEKQPTQGCTDLETGESFRIGPYWQSLLDQSLENVLEQSLTGLSSWNDVMLQMTAKLTQRLLDEKKILIADPVYREQLNGTHLPRYLFLQIAEVMDAHLRAAYERLGKVPGDLEQDSLRLQATAAFRQALINAIRDVQEEEDSSLPEAHVVVLPEAGTVWMQQAIADNLLQAAVGGQITYINPADGQKTAIEKWVDTYGRVCERSGSQQRNDFCLEVLAKYGPSNESDAEDVPSAVQVNLLAGGVISTFEEAVDVYYPQSIFPIEARLVNTVVQSAPFPKVETTPQEKSLESAYLQSIALDVADQLGKEMAERALMTYREELK